MNNYEAMFIVKPNLTDEEKKTLFDQISDTVSKNNGKLTSVSVWAEKRKLCFTIKKFNDGLYYLTNFSISPEVIQDIRHTYKLNENILRVLITRIES